MLFVYHSGCNPWIVTVTELLFTNHQHKPFVMQKKVLFVLSKSTSNYTLKVLSSEVINLIMTPPGIEPRTPAWEAGILTAWLRSHIQLFSIFVRASCQLHIFWFLVCVPQMVSYITLAYAAKFLSRTRTLVSGVAGVLPIILIRYYVLLRSEFGQRIS